MPPRRTRDPEFAPLASELAENVGKTVKTAAELGLMIAETVGVTLRDMMSPARAPGGGTRARTSRASPPGDVKETLPEFGARTASMLTDLVVNRGVAALRAVQDTARTRRRRG